MTDKNKKWSAAKVQRYIDNHVVDGKASPISGQELLDLANKNNFPIELALIQGAQESNFGTSGAGETTNNIYNWGNFTEGDDLTKEEA